MRKYKGLNSFRGRSRTKIHREKKSFVNLWTISILGSHYMIFNALINWIIDHVIGNLILNKERLIKLTNFEREGLKIEANYRRLNTCEFIRQVGKRVFLKRTRLRERDSETEKMQRQGDASQGVEWTK